ncbi:MAG TPA: diacylglycerol kinase family protein, partial [Vicinamibacterales bacterium]|nr:diacylglycerol kinase family protein [Vicinamibacterales bacterium]
AAARILAGRGVPLTILPVGTANNIAKSFGIDGAVDDLIEKWGRAELQPFDLGVARGPWGTRRFLESVGGGLIPAGIAAAQAHGVDHDEEAAAKVTQAARTYLDVVSHLEARRCTVSLDGTSTMGDFLLVEVLNTPCIGPNLVLSNDASPSDGFFSVVIAAEEHREEICDYLEHVIAGLECDLVLDSHRATRIEIYGREDIHVDDTLLRSTAADMISLRIEPAALQVLA